MIYISVEDNLFIKVLLCLTSQHHKNKQTNKKYVYILDFFWPTFTFYFDRKV